MSSPTSSNGGEWRPQSTWVNLNLDGAANHTHTRIQKVVKDINLCTVHCLVVEGEEQQKRVGVRDGIHTTAKLRCTSNRTFVWLPISSLCDDHHSTGNFKEVRTVLYVHSWAKWWVSWIRQSNEYFARSELWFKRDFEVVGLVCEKWSGSSELSNANVSMRDELEGGVCSKYIVKFVPHQLKGWVTERVRSREIKRDITTGSVHGYCWK